MDTTTSHPCVRLAPQAAHCKFEGLELSCDIPGLKPAIIDSISESVTNLLAPLKDVEDQFMSAFKSTLKVKLDAAATIRPDDGSGLFSRVAWADEADLAVDCR